jgi:FkbM family methyltransferase
MARKTDARPSARRQAVAHVTIMSGGKPHRFSFFDTPLGRHVLNEVLSGASYPLQPQAGSVHTILDIGANVGAATLYFALHYPEARLLAFEPAPASYDLLVCNTRGLKNVEAFNFGLAESSRSAALYLGNQDSVTNSVCASCLNTTSTAKVRLRAANTALRQLGVRDADIVKLDTEGCEVPILRSLTPMLPRIGVIYIEYHGEADRLEIDRLLTGTHLLVQGRALGPHRGEFCYVAKGRLPANVDDGQIRGFSEKRAVHKAIP